MSNVYQIAHARKRKVEEGEVMHLVTPDNDDRNTGCSSCRICSICKEAACNAIKDCRDRWTDDIDIWHNHTNCCKPPIIIGEQK